MLGVCRAQIGGHEELVVRLIVIAPFEGDVEQQRRRRPAHAQRPMARLAEQRRVGVRQVGGNDDGVGGIALVGGRGGGDAFAHAFDDPYVGVVDDRGAVGARRAFERAHERADPAARKEHALADLGVEEQPVEGRARIRRHPEIHRLKAERCGRRAEGAGGDAPQRRERSASHECRELARGDERAPVADARADEFGTCELVGGRGAGEIPQQTGPRTRREAFERGDRVGQRRRDLDTPAVGEVEPLVWDEPRQRHLPVEVSPPACEQVAVNVRHEQQRRPEVEGEAFMGPLRGPAARPVALLENRHAVAAMRQQGSGRQPGDPGPDHDDALRRHVRADHPPTLGADLHFVKRLS